MEVLAGAEGFTPVTNVEMYHLLKHRLLQTAKKGPGRLNIPAQQKEIEQRIYYYLRRKVRHYRRETFARLWDFFSIENGFTSSERLQIANDVPQSLPVLYGIIPNIEDRFSAARIAEIQAFLQGVLADGYADDA